MGRRDRVRPPGGGTGVVDRLARWGLPVLSEAASGCLEQEGSRESGCVHAATRTSSRVVLARTCSDPRGILG